MLYEAFLIHLEPKTLSTLAEMIYANVPREDFVIETELMNLANEIRARLEKLTNGINPQHVCGTPTASCDTECAASAAEPDWLKC